MSDKNIKATTQDHLDIEEIKNDLVVLRNGAVCAVLSTTAVNFDLLSEIEQDAIIASFSMLLNSITFPIQVVVRSKQLDITKYIEKIKRTEDKLTDPLLKHQAESYRKFVQDFIKNNEVLDKKFYVVIATGGSTEHEVGSSPFEWMLKLFGTHTRRVRVNVTQALEEAKTKLLPRVDHVMGEFNRIGVRSRMLTTQELVELYFDIYNPSSIHGQRIRTNIEDYKTAVVNPAILEE
jgi:type IV secretory pathway VirB4 component